MIYDRECIIDNPYYVQDEMTEEDCDVCRKLRNVEKVSNVSQSSIANDYLFSNVPVIVTDAMEDWDALKKFDINFLTEVKLPFPLIYSHTVMKLSFLPVNNDVSNIKMAEAIHMTAKCHFSIYLFYIMR